MDQFEKLNYLSAHNAEYIDELFVRYQQNPDAIDPSWRYFFDGLELGAEFKTPETGAPTSSPTVPTTSTSASSGLDLGAEAKVTDLIRAYREFGRLIANTNPLGSPPKSHPTLELARFGLSESDLGKTYHSGKQIGLGASKLSEILVALKETYSSSVAVEFVHIPNLNEREWLQGRMEASRNRQNLNSDTQRFILKRLTESECFERFLHTRYVAQKRFSVEGGESTIPLLDCMIETGAELGAQQFVLGMAHRGRLNVLVNVFKKKPDYILTQFEGAYSVDPKKGEGDVKYHMGWSHDFTTRFGKKTHLSMASNPSHLEFVNPVIEGIARAKQTQLGDLDRTKVIPILIHGDAAFSGQGVCFETLNFCGLEGFATGGTLHLVINNQVGFTTFPHDSRSTPYSTDLAKMLDVPIFHINGDDPEAVWHVAQLATEYRQKFHKDVIIDLVCYRKHGHNEGDEPSFTQPLMYKKIKTHPSTRELYATRLIEKQIIEAPQAQEYIDQSMAVLSEAQARTKAENPSPHLSSLEGKWAKIQRPTHEDLFKTVNTAVPEQKLKDLSSRLNQLPASFHLHSKLTRFFEMRLKAIQDGKGIDWGNAESLAFGSLVDEGHGIRITGQDAERGTFTHRHSVVTDTETGEKYTPLNHLRPGQANYQVHNSHLSETGVMGFEYGYSLADPDSLVIWEAQFGDFANGAQVMIDQFLTTSESKWQRMTGLVLLLPHGFEGQGPEHSSARLERFLQLCGRDNIAVCNLSTPAQIFHALRRQVKRTFRKPLVIMSPKSLLRHPQAVSSLKDLTQGAFQEVIDDAEITKTGATRILLCTGKVYYDLLAARAAKTLSDVAIIRVEQLYPFPEDRLAQVLAQYPNAGKLIWVQEEPRNMGAWTYIFNQWAGGYSFFQEKAGNRPIQYVGRDIAAAPAVGSHKVHEKEQKTLVEKAFTE